MQCTEPTQRLYAWGTSPTVILIISPLRNYWNHRLLHRVTPRWVNDVPRRFRSSWYKAHDCYSRYPLVSFRRSHPLGHTTSHDAYSWCMSSQMHIHTTIMRFIPTNVHAFHIKSNQCITFQHIHYHNMSSLTFLSHVQHKCSTSHHKTFHTILQQIGQLPHN